MDKFEVFKSADLFAKELIKEENFVYFFKLKKEIDELYKKEISEFLEAKGKYESAREFGFYQPDLHEKQQVFQSCKTTLYSIPKVQEYFKLEKEIQKKLNDIAKDIASSVSSRFSEKE